MDADRYIRLSRAMAHALRHRPDRYGLALDKDGWTPLSGLVEALAGASREWRDLTADDVCAVIASADKQRYETGAGRIRALYGHSLAGRIEKVPAAPPGLLYHGTAPAALAGIRREGLRPMRRQYVHLSPDTDMAVTVASRRTDAPVIITVHAGEAYADGAIFYRANEQVWLSESLAVRYLSFPGD